MFAPGDAPRVTRRGSLQLNRVRRCSPTRIALAITVSPGFTAPMLGKKLVSTMYKLSSSCALQSTSSSGCRRVGTEPGRAGLVGDAGDLDVHSHVEILVEHMVLRHPDVVQDLPELAVQVGGLRIFLLV